MDLEVVQSQAPHVVSSIPSQSWGRKDAGVNNAFWYDNPRWQGLLFSISSCQGETHPKRQQMPGSQALHPVGEGSFGEEAIRDCRLEHKRGNSLGYFFFLEQCTRFWAWSHPKMKVIALLPIAPDGDRDGYIVPIALSSSRAEAMQYFSQSAESETLLTSKIRLKTHPRCSSTKATCFLFL